MAVVVRWAIDAHKKETSDKNYVGSVAWRCNATETEKEATGSVNGTIILTKPDEVIAYATFMGTGNTNLVAAVKAQLGSTKVAEIETEAKAALTKLTAPTHEWVQGPT